MAGARPLSGPEQAQLLAAIGSSRNRLLVLAGIFLGFRIGELLSLRISDVWTVERGPRREVTVSRRRLKGGQGTRRGRICSRTVPVHPLLAAAVQDHVVRTYAGRSPAPNRFLFPSRKGSGPISRVQAHRIVKAAAIRSCEPTRISTHSFRKTFARSVYELSGHDLPLTQRALGHRAIDTTIKYLESTPDAVRSIIFRMPGPSAFLDQPPVPAAAEISQDTIPRRASM